MSTPHVYTAINAVQEALAKTGIEKSQKNDQQGYAFRGIDDVYGALAPLIAKHKLCILPRVVSREVLERQTRSGGALFYTTLQVEYDFVSVEDGSKHTVVVVGEAMDSGDKATNKAMSAAYKYVCLQAFCIPTEGDNDADKTTQEDIAPAPAPSKPAVVKRNPGNEIKKVGPDEIASITALAKSADIDLNTICGKYGIAMISELPLEKTAAVTARLQELIANQAKAA